MNNTPTPAYGGAALLSLLWLFATCAHGDITIDVSGVDGDIRINVLSFLSLQRYADNSSVTPETVQRIYQRIPQEVRAAVKPFGFYEAKIATTLKREGEAGRDWRATVKIDLGLPVIIHEVEIIVTGPGATSPIFKRVLARSTMTIGQRLQHADYENLKSSLERTAAANGYLDAKFERRELLVDTSKRSASVHLVQSTGPRYHFGSTQIEQTVIEAQLMNKYLRYHPNDFYDTGALLRTQFALDDSQYFSAVEVLPGVRDPNTLTVPIIIRTKPNKKNRYSVGVGYGTDTRWRGTLAWDDRLINARGHHSRVAVKLSGISQELEAHYIIPIGDPALEKFSIESTYGRTTLGDVTTTGLIVKPGLTQVMGNWQRVFFVSGNETISRTNFTRTNDRLLIPGMSYASIPKGYFGQPIAGRGLFVELTGSVQALGANGNFLRLLVQDDRRFDLSKNWHLLLRGQLGATVASQLSEIPANQRFFAGGDRSVRGFALNDLSPVDVHGQKIGGRDLVVASVEIERALPRSFAVAGFVDAGNAMDSFHSPLKYAVGVGFRWKLPAISVGFDVARAIYPRGLGPRLHLNIEPNF